MIHDPGIVVDRSRVDDLRRSSMRRFARGSILLTPGLVLMVAGCLLTACPRSPADEPPSKEESAKKVEDAAKRKDAALKAAESYLVLLDKGKYAESWEASCEDLRKGLPQRKWVDALSKTRKPFGKLRSRKLNRIETKATGDPERINQVWVYSDLWSTAGVSCGELAIVTLEKGKEWRVAAYYIGDPGLFPRSPVEEKEAKEAEEKEAKAAKK
jgi:Protein of unknown function (DUF4019)